MKTDSRYPEFLGIKVPADLAAEICRAAREDDRTVSGYLRRLLAAAVRPTTAEPPDEATSATGRRV